MEEVEVVIFHLIFTYNIQALLHLSILTTLMGIESHFKKEGNIPAILNVSKVVGSMKV
ncbi:hypothetical protein T07_3098 [Trichinella nelsoni]|uniref:Uncharacterized protein n=1 Tax=Trichinella nelsoni TaxID=6336 RepID=A0A0V0RCX0_9BILA|nr:hypothetical protein T07_3098 [Trichinella nelsoni]